MSIPSLPVIGSGEMGGAERWFVRFLRAMQRAGEPVSARRRAERRALGRCQPYRIAMMRRPKHNAAPTSAEIP